FILGVLLHPENQAMPFPLIFTGPDASADYFEEIDQFIALTLGDQARSRYQIIIDDPEGVAHAMRAGVERVREYRIETKDAFYYNWLMRIDESFQLPFEPTHEAMRQLGVSRALPKHELAANLRRVFSAIVSGNVKANGIQRIRQHGPFEIQGDAAIMQALDQLLQRFVRQDRMKLPGGTAYEPCYRIVS
ncbi:MAG: pyrimidine/purine nucleotide monophosphate nucleosidase domain-containing protein, partial [Pseudomonadota bacterium]